MLLGMHISNFREVDMNKKLLAFAITMTIISVLLTCALSKQYLQYALLKHELQNEKFEKQDLFGKLIESNYKQQVQANKYLATNRLLKNSTSLTVTAYTARPEECNDEPWVSAWGNETLHNQLAISRDLEKVGWQRGDKILFNDLGIVLTIGDRMNSRWGERVDVLMHDKELADKFGIGKMYATNLSKISRLSK